MYLLVIAVILTALKYFEIGPVANMDWMWILSVYGLTVVWWAWADKTGYTKRKAMEKMAARKQDRINKNKEAMGIAPRKPR
ncbi:MAG: TIGR04438 family Trp-rich protein [Pseudomonadota bacterium]